MILVAVLLCSQLRGCQLLESKRAALSLLLEAALHCHDEARLQTVVPYMLSQVGCVVGFEAGVYFLWWRACSGGLVRPRRTAWCTLVYLTASGLLHPKLSRHPQPVTPAPAPPALTPQVSDPATSVRTLALRCLVHLMASVTSLPPSDANVLVDYLLPSLSLLPNDSEVSEWVGERSECVSD